MKLEPGKNLTKHKKTVMRTDVRIAVCSQCGRYGLIRTSDGKCACEHNHGGSHDCRERYCKHNSRQLRLQRREVDREDRREAQAR